MRNKKVISLGACMIFLGLMLPGAEAQTGDRVVLLHGIARTAGSMDKLARFLTRHGYRVLNIDYPSRKESMADLVDRIRKQVETFNTDPSRRIHFVGASMGGLLIRGLIHRHRPANLGRAVLIAPPNQGSEVADALKNWAIYKKWYGPAGQELVTRRPQALAELLGEVDYDLGVIAGDRSIDPVSSMILPGRDDGKVTVERTRIAGMKDHIVLHATHTFIHKKRETLEQTVHFLQHGQFRKETPGE